MTAGRKTREHYDGVTPFYVNGATGVVLYDLLDEHGHPYQIIPKPVTTKEPPVPKPSKKYERVGRFYLIKHTGYWGRVRIDGDGTEYSHRTKKEATEAAWRVTTREAEAERRAARKAEQEAQHAD